MGPIGAIGRMGWIGWIGWIGGVGAGGGAATASEGSSRARRAMVLGVTVRSIGKVARGDLYKTVSVLSSGAPPMLQTWYAAWLARDGGAIAELRLMSAFLHLTEELRVVGRSRCQIGA